jgi:hypothetical protein
MVPPKISDLLKKINSALNNPDFESCSKLEFDLLQQQIRDLYEQLSDWEKNQSKPDVRTALEQIAKSESPKVQKIFNSNKNLLLNEAEEVKEVEVQIAKQEKTEERIKHGKTASINESIQSFSSLNEKLKTPEAKEVHKKLASKPLKDLLDLNKKFVLVNELFSGDAASFQQVVLRIDAIEDFSLAEKYFEKELLPQYKWDVASQTTKLFLKLIKQRFGVS